MLEIIPAILEKDWQGIERKINLVKPFAHTIQIDIIDGKFAPFKTFLDPESFVKYSKDFFLELHLMVENPLVYLKPFAKAGFKRFIAHVESLPQLADQDEFIAQGRLFGEIGLALDDSTGIDSLKIPLSNLDCLLVMLVKAGSSGQHFNLANIEKIRQLRAKTQIPIEVDGGVNPESIISAKEAGANRFSVNSFLYSAQNPQESYNLLINQ
jgi:ribulose-phosphate 3-epimerase